VNASSPRLPVPASTPGHDVTASAIRRLAVCSVVAIAALLDSVGKDATYKFK
jgi:hypothetical protein